MHKNTEFLFLEQSRHKYHGGLRSRELDHVNTLLLFLETIQHGCINKTLYQYFSTYLLLSTTKFCQQNLTLLTNKVGMCWSRSTDTMHLLPRLTKKDISKGGPVEERLMYDSQHTAKFELSTQN